MDLIIVRHGKAEDISQKPEGSDFNRSLTDEGVVQVRTMAKILKGITKYNEYKNIRIVARRLRQFPMTVCIMAIIMHLFLILFQSMLKLTV